MVKCEECDAEIKIPEDSIEGEIVSCPDCGSSYELVNFYCIDPNLWIGEQFKTAYVKGFVKDYLTIYKFGDSGI
jgi:alpha-aminoadipate carrier protein LysW